MSEIADIFGIKLSTVARHLWDALQDGAVVRSEGLLDDCTLSAEEQQRVLNLFNELGAGQLRPIYEALEEAVSYEQLHLVRLYSVAKALEQEQHPQSRLESPG